MSDPSLKERTEGNVVGNFFRAAGDGAKRALDVTASASGLLVPMPLFAFIAFLIRRKSSGDVFFHQTRIGCHGVPFVLHKFRTMADHRGENGTFLPDEQRLTDVGRWLRRWSLDELPELVNVLKGEMSLVGPRPLLPQYLPRYSQEQARRHEVKPGLTGWAQVNGRNAISWEEKFALDVWYVDNRSFWLDLKIIAMTVAKVVRGEGISAPGEATMSEFMGTAGAGKEKGRNA